MILKEKSNHGVQEDEVDISEVRELLPAEILLERNTVGDYEHCLYPEERSYVASAVARRQKEFASGRFCARRALTKLARLHCAIPVGPMREPIWPKGISGSITHDGGFVMAAVALKKDIPLLGIDLALSEPLQASVVEMICTKGEIVRLNQLAQGMAGRDPFKLVFSLKEAFYKCTFPLINRVFEFTDVSVDLIPEDSGAEITFSNKKILPQCTLKFQARYSWSGRYIFSAVWCA